jgi:site-specific DNA-methyltransferase (adenine-specific)
MKNREIRIHPTQKPADLYRWIYRLFTEPGFKVLDTHLGSGTSRRAAYDFGLDFVGCEKDKTYFDLQERAYEEYTAQIRMEGI